MRSAVRESEDNARLIAAAPDMLAALEGALKYVPYGDSPVVNSMRAAIAKAKGDDA